MSLIGKLRDWGESLFTSKKTYIAQQSLPMTSGYSDQIIPDSTGTSDVVAPCDGWVNLISSTLNGQNYQLYTEGAQFLLAGNFNCWYRASIPVKKGDVVHVHSEGTASTLRFVRSIGGGINQILQSGGALCLRLKNVLSRFSSSQVVKQLHLQKQFLLMCPHLVKNTQRHLTGLYALVEMRNVLLPRFRGIQSKLLHSATTASGQAQLFQLEKVQQYGLTLKERGRCSVTSLLALAQANLAKEVCHA